MKFIGCQSKYNHIKCSVYIIRDLPIKSFNTTWWITFYHVSAYQIFLGLNSKICHLELRRSVVVIWGHTQSIFHKFIQLLANLLQFSCRIFSVKSAIWNSIFHLLKIGMSASLNTIRFVVLSYQILLLNIFFESLNFFLK